jgi:uncharacterized protein YdhG (YjbR/CyaY superfamily)
VSILDTIEATQPKRTMLLTIGEFRRLKGEAWSHRFSTRVGKRAGKLYREVMRRAPRKRRSKLDGRNATAAIPHGIFEQAFEQVSAEIVAMAEKLGVQDWVETPSTWPGEGLRSKADEAADKLQAEFPGITRQDAITIHRATRDRKPRVFGTGKGRGDGDNHFNLFCALESDLRDAVKAEYGDDLTYEELELLVRMRLRKDPELAATLANLDALWRTKP